ncbi:MAG: amidohydrolase [Deltaproteobacteria bacterium]|nr:amidohydrolase [Deltaproteobacteria bacterium]MBW2696695.1 amidohydrolase [Deltaproteobacteria bacterium]
METPLSAMPIIDVDSHFTEPRDFWTRRSPARYRDRAPRVVVDDAGHERWIVDEDVFLGPPGFCVIRKDGGKTLGTMSLDTFEEMHPAATHPKERLELMDEHGLSLQIVYPNVLGFAGSMIMRVTDVELRNFCSYAYNDGVAELQSAGEQRLYPQAVLPFWDIDLAVKELARCHEELGLTGVILTDAPETWGLPSLGDRHWEPLFGAAQERGLPINFHIGGGHFAGAPWGGGPPGTDLATMSSLAFIGNVRCVANLIFSGLLDRFPSLRFVSVESGLGWIPFLLDFCEYQMDQNQVTGLELRPREYFARQIYASYWFETDAADAIQKLPEDNVMFETDFPHPTCLYPGIQDQVQASLGGFPEALQRKILYENAARVYRLPEPTAVTS